MAVEERLLDEEEVVEVLMRELNLDAPSARWWLEWAVRTGHCDPVEELTDEERKYWKCWRNLQ